METIPNTKLLTLHCYPRGWGKREAIPNTKLLTLHCYPWG